MISLIGYEGKVREKYNPPTYLIDSNKKYPPFCLLLKETDKSKLVLTLMTQIETLIAEINTLYNNTLTAINRENAEVIKRLSVELHLKKQALKGLKETRDPCVNTVGELAQIDNQITVVLGEIATIESLIPQYENNTLVSELAQTFLDESEVVVNTLKVEINSKIKLLNTMIDTPLEYIE